jgi:hypothetical protein
MAIRAVIVILLTNQQSKVVVARAIVLVHQTMHLVEIMLATVVATAV